MATSSRPPRSLFKAISAGACLFVVGFVTLSQLAGDRKMALSGMIVRRDDDNYVLQLERKLAELTSRVEELSRPVKETPPSTETPKCRMRKRVAFAKTHKTGSSTLQNVLFRFGVRHNLTFAMPPKSWMFSFKEPFRASVVLDGPWASLKFDLFVFHSVWNYPEVRKVLPDDAFYVTLLRDPVDAFESNYVYMGLQAAHKMDVNEFARKKAAGGIRRGPRAIIGKNQLLWDLGVPAEDAENAAKVREAVDRFDRQFDLVMTAERFEESLVLLAEELCWPLEEVTYLRQNERVAEKKSNVTAETRRILREWLWADYVLYDHFAEKLKSRITQFGEDEMTARRTRLRSLNEKVVSSCVRARGSNEILKGEFRMALPIVLGYVVEPSRPWCALYARSEPSFTRQIRDSQTWAVKQMKLRGQA